MIITGVFAILLVLTLAAANFARERFSAAMKAGRGQPAPLEMTAAEIAREFLDAHDRDDVKISPHNALVTDYYDPKRRTLFLHPEVMNGTTLAAWALALHEAAHATQIGIMGAALDMRLSNIRLTRYVPALSGLAFAVLGFLRRPPFPIGWRIVAVIWFIIMVLNAMSLPVEFNASERALAFLERKLRKDPQALERLERVLKGMAWRDTAVFLRSPLYCLFGALPMGGTMRPR